MNHNPFDLKAGQKVILDEEYANKSEVIIHEFSNNQLFATVYSEKSKTDKWAVMTNRLTPMK